ncbi:MAG: triose-phosphate isomerase [Desulfobacterales bacterium]|jgi:triosephosphate isomerase|nr:triose-phosphate isomerase [Desulfobacterales bacterium]
MNRRPLIAGNWKMYKTCEEAAETAKKLTEFLSPPPENIDIMIAPAFTALSTVASVIQGSCIALGAQNMSWEKEGAFTGEISAPMLISCGCHYVIIGHSERRHLFGETDEVVNRKIKAAIRHNLIPVLCVGETEEEREQKKTFSVLDKQTEKGVEELSSTELATLVVAYEPVWAIGTGKTATVDQAQEAHAYLRGVIEKKLGNHLAKSIRILYGGSVKPNNIESLLKMPDVDGALVGGASLQAESFRDLVLYNQ